MSGVPGHTPFTYKCDLAATIVEKTPLRTQWELCMLNFRYIAQAISTLTINTLNVPPVMGGVVVSNGTFFGLVAPTANGQVLVSDSSQPFGVKWTDLATLLKANAAFPDDERRLLEQMVILMGQVLEQIEKLNEPQ